MNPDISTAIALPRVALVAAGTVGTAVTALLGRAGCPQAGVWSRSGPSLERAVTLLDAPRIDLTAALDADLVIVGASDGAIEQVARMLAPAVLPGTVVAHLSGSLGLDVLAPVTDVGAEPVAMHPVQACPTIPAALERLPGSAWGITARSEETALAVEGWVRDLLDGTPARVAERDRPVWHAACVMTSNGIAALMAFGEALLERIGIADPVSVLGPLAAGTVTNATEGGGGGATLTGPVVRGEAQTLERHLAALVEREPGLVPDYKKVVATILAAAREHGRIDEAAAARIEELLS